MATAGSDNIIRLWDLSTRRELGQLTGHAGSVSALAYQDGILVSGGFDTFLRIWQVPDQVRGRGAFRPTRCSSQQNQYDRRRPHVGRRMQAP